MHRSLKPHPQAKKVAPPAIPGDNQQPLHHYHQQIPLYRLGRQQQQQQQRIDDGLMMSSMVSSPSIEEGGFNLPRETTVAIRIKDEINDYATAMASSTSNNKSSSSSSAIAVAPAVVQTALPAVIGCPQPPAVFCATLREPLTHKAAVYYHQQLALQEDQGIDLTQSPGRDSPGSSSGSAGSGSRHSTASLDSGRASSYLTGVSCTSNRGGGSGSGGGGGSSSSGGGGGGGPLSSPRCSSVSSCSIGSVDRVSQRNDELIIDWLLEMKYEEYAQLFIAAGYDLPTIARMTPEDLTAIGIKNPHHRERIKQRIDKLQILDNLPHFVPGSIEEWLQLLRLEEYIQPLLDQNYKTVRDVTQVTWEDLEDIGIVKLGHQKKILLAIKRVKDIISGKWNPGGQNAYQQQQQQLQLQQQQQQQQDYRKTWQNTVQMPIIAAATAAMPTTRVSWDDSKSYGGGGDAYYNCSGGINHECCGSNDIVLIKVRQPRGKSLESLEDIHDNSTRSHLTFSHYTTTDYGHFAHPSQMQHHLQLQQQQQQQQQALAASRLMNNPAGNMSWRRSYDDGDITPTNEAGRELMYEDGGGTLPRQQRANAVDRCKILQRAVLNSMPPMDHHHYMNASAAEYICHAAAMGAGGGGNGSDSLNAPYLSGSPMASKKIAPDPPRRHCSIRNSRTLNAQQESSNNISGNSSSNISSSNIISQQQHQQQAAAVAAAHAQNVFYSATAAAASSGGGIVSSSGGGGVGVVVVGSCGGGQLIHCNQTSYIPASMQSQQPIYANYATIQQTTAEIHCEKLHHDNKSNSSIDSIDTIPFANENTGTIKQRLLNRQDLPPQHLSSSSSSSSSSTNTIANIAHSFHSLKSSTSLHDASSLIRSDSIGSNVSGGSGGGGVMAAHSTSHIRSPTTFQFKSDSCSSSSSVATIAATTADILHHHHHHQELSPSSSATAAAAATIIGGAASSSAGGGGDAVARGISPTVLSTQNKTTVSVNVLNDIGNMLANLTDELDAMLEEEKRVGLNIDSE